MARSPDSAAQFRARAEQLLRQVDTAAPPGSPTAGLLEPVHLAGAAVRDAVDAPLSVAVLAESAGDDRVVSHNLWGQILGDQEVRISPERTITGYVTVVRLQPVDRPAVTLGPATVDILDRDALARCRRDLLARLDSGGWGSLPADAGWPEVVAQARRLGPATDSDSRGWLRELYDLYRAESFAEHLLGTTDRPVRLATVHHAAMPFARPDAALRQPFAELDPPAVALPAETGLTDGVLHRILPAVARVVVPVQVPASLWDLDAETLDLVDLPMLHPHRPAGRERHLIENELVRAGAVVVLPGPDAAVPRFTATLNGAAPSTVLDGPESRSVLAGRVPPDRYEQLRAAVTGTGRAAALAVRAERARLAHLGLRGAIREVVVALDRAPAEQPAPTARPEDDLREVLGRIAQETAALIDDVEEGITGSRARLATGMTPQDAVRQAVTAQVHAWPQWSVLLAALSQQTVKRGTGFGRDELPDTPDVFEARFRAAVGESAATVEQVVDAVVANWLTRRAARVVELKAALLARVEPVRGRLVRPTGEPVLPDLRRAVQLDWLAQVRPEDDNPTGSAAAGVPRTAAERQALRQAFPLDPVRPLPWAADGGLRTPSPHGNHQVAVMRLRRELVEATRRLALARLAVELPRRAEAIHRSLRALQQRLPRTDGELRALVDGPDAHLPPEPPATVARRLETALDHDDDWPTLSEER
ncbi:hypothetical protein [Micromonospora sp. NBC_01796]|uniref:hypothetical protein n=1 Tax=Micromonospora sp. NBC_01796 TaxID=2975987 RepID=UPI002DD91612|nr:hypothetical protein [Micromonospora sp. NBC_01796]WSA83772.1 hypothetical protein OIE47_25765 [Micromonospora sp. NBC_01796]